MTRNAVKNIANKGANLVIGQAKFNANNIKTRMGSLDEVFTEFGSTLEDISAIVKSLIDNGAEKSAVHGTVGKFLWKIWDDNSSTFSEFKANFSQWSKAVAVISATNSDFMVEINAIYRDSAETLKKVKETSTAYAEGRVDLNKFVESSNFYSNVEANEFIESYGLESNGTRAWLDNYEKLSDDAKKVISEKNVDKFIEKFDESEIGSSEWNDAYGKLSEEQRESVEKKYKQKYGVNISDSTSGSNDESSTNSGEQSNSVNDSSNATPTSRQYNRGDIVNVNGETLTYYGTTNDGINLFKNGESDYLYYVKDGNLCQSTGTVENLDSGYGINVDGNVIYTNSINSSVNYADDSASGMEYVDTLSGSTGNGNVYYSGNSDLNSSATHITASNGNDAFAEAVENHENLYIDADGSVKSDPWGIWNTKTLSDGRNPTYLVYDENTGKYYVADSNGTYSTSETAYSPEDFLKDDGGVHF